MADELKHILKDIHSSIIDVNIAIHQLTEIIVKLIPITNDHQINTDNSKIHVDTRNKYMNKNQNESMNHFESPEIISLSIKAEHNEATSAQQITEAKDLCTIDNNQDESLNISSESLNIDNKDESLNINDNNEIQSKWLPTKLYGKITETDKAYIYTFKKTKYQFKYNNISDKPKALEEACNKQINISLDNTRNTYYTIKNNIIYLKLDQDKYALCDQEDLHLILDKVWYYYKNNVIVRSNDKRLKMSEILTGEKTIYHSNGNVLDNRRCNLSKIPVNTNDTDDDSSTILLLTKNQWQSIVNEANQDNNQLEKCVSKLCQLSEQLPTFPLPVYNEHELYSDFIQLLQNSSKNLHNIPKGSKVLFHFMKEAIFYCQKKNYPTIYQVWNDLPLKARLWKSMIKLKMSLITPSNLVRAFALKFYKVGNFPPLIARNLYDYYFLPKQSDKRVLDFCSGFGGRLLGFWTSNTCTEYVGIDPNPRLVEPYQLLINWLTINFPKNKQIQMIKACAEDINYEQFGLFDIIFTSPPYFNLESYGSEETQSSVRYPTIELWRDKFLFNVITKVTVVLKKGGILAINMKQSKEWSINLIEQMSLFITDLSFKTLSPLSFPLSKRPSADTISCEYIYFFEKL